MKYNYKDDKLTQPSAEKNPFNIPGPFYTMSHCIVCGAPGITAPDHIKFTNEIGIKNETGTYSCVVVKHPENIEELKVMIEAMDASCVECIRYCGTHEVVIDLISNAGYAHLIDR